MSGTSFMDPIDADSDSDIDCVCLDLVVVGAPGKRKRKLGADQQQSKRARVYLQPCCRSLAYLRRFCSTFSPCVQSKTLLVFTRHALDLAAIQGWSFLRNAMATLCNLSESMFFDLKEIHFGLRMLYRSYKQFNHAKYLGLPVCTNKM